MATRDYNPSVLRETKVTSLGPSLVMPQRKENILKDFPILYITKSIYDSWEELKYQQFQEFGRS